MKKGPAGWRGFFHIPTMSIERREESWTSAARQLMAG
jgi:hypothetical protein